MICGTHIAWMEGVPVRWLAVTAGWGRDGLRMQGCMFCCRAAVAVAYNRTGLLAPERCNA